VVNLRVEGGRLVPDGEGVEVVDGKKWLELGFLTLWAASA